MGSEVRKLLVRVDHALTLDAGGWFEARDEDGATWRQVDPPERTLFDQLLDYLGKLPPEPKYTGLRLAEETAAATALCLRWGTYLAVLLDGEKPLWKGARQEGLSRMGRSASPHPRRSAVARNRGGLRDLVSPSKAWASFKSTGSLHARPKNEIPTGSPRTRPAGTVMLG